MTSEKPTTGTITIRAYAELNNFLPRRWRQRDFPYPLSGGHSLKHIVESAGIPHTEVEVILHNGKSVDFSSVVNDGDRISLYPLFESIDVTNLIKLRAKTLRKTRFVLDVHLGKLTLILRLLGFDVLFPGNVPDRELARISAEDDRILLTRDTMLLKRKIVSHGCYMHSQDPIEQAMEVLDRLDLRDSIVPFSRCPQCGGRLYSVKKNEILHRLKPLTKKYYTEFSICDECDKIFWKGSHYYPLLKMLEKLGVQLPIDGGGNDSVV